MAYSCLICEEEIKDGEQIYELKCGSINKDDFSGRGFDEVESMLVHGYIHAKCFFEIDEEED